MGFGLRLWLGVLVAAFLTACGSSDRRPVTTAHSLNGLWVGQYTYDRGNLEPVAIAAVLSEDHDVVHGRLIEPNTFGDVQAPSLDSWIDGTIDGSEVHLTFTYDGSGGVSHRVVNDLHCSRDGGDLSGTWQITPTWTGTLTLRKIADTHRQHLVRSAQSSFAPARPITPAR